MEDGAIKPNLLNVRNKLEDGVKEKLERIYGVRITRDALTVSCNIARRCFDDEGKSLESREALLQSKAADLLEKACGTLRFRLDAGEVDEDEKSLDADEYKLVRSCIEIHEIWKDKDPDREAWLHHLHQELRDSMDKWDRYFNKWKPFPKKQHKRSPEILVKEAQLLQGLLQELLSCLPNNGSLHSSIRTDWWNEMVRQLDVLVTLNSDGFDKKFQQFVTVGPKLIAKVASSETGFPASWLLHSSLKPPVDDLVTRLSRRQFGKRFPILTISRALSRAECPSPLGCVTRPIGSFLFLCGQCHDGPELAEALTEELFKGKGSLIHFDLSKYTEPDSVSRFLGVPTSQGELGSSGELTDALEKNPFSIVLFSNIDAASVSVVDMVTEISRCGRLTNSQGKTIDFTKTLIIMTSTIGVDKEVSFGCDCFRMVEECPIKELLNLHPEESKHRCSTFSRLKEVQKQFGHKLFEQLDDIVVFSSLGFQNAKAIARLQLREIASLMTPKGLIIYPSEALLTEILWMAFWWQGGEKLVKVWLEENLVPVLQLMCKKGEIKDNYIIYIDTLVGTQELSYRLVKLEDFFEEEALKQVKKKSAELKVLCRKQKARINRIYWLNRKLYGVYALNPTTSVDTGTDFKFVDGTIQELVDIIKLMINETDANIVGDKEKVVQRGMKEEVDLGLGDGGSKRAKKGVESLKAQLHNGLWGQATNIVAKAAKMIMDAPHYPPSLPVAAFLFLGLTTSSKEKIIGDLAENFVADDGTKLLFTIDLSEYTDLNSLSRLTDALSGFTVREYCKGEQFPGSVRMRPCSILFLDQVEKAHMSVFTALLSVLDRSMFIDHRGRTVGFRDTIVIISSDAGNKGIFSRLVGNASQNILDSDTKQEVKGFRFELLNRVGEMVFLDPFASHDDQLRKFATLSMLSGPHLKGRSPSGFSRTFFSLFKPANDLDGDSVEDPPEEYKSEDIVIRDLSKKLNVYDGSSRILVQ
ncbi:chaperone protein ClpB1-like [Rhododendron vialii]|uniref:chaperone protein ClpB1-like n=1 Tax=Rhododendron vialii TaxID=182163 RepID=UPI00265FA60A|nr:chaperone protein ClpB1-like [Rhododendron vialii]